MKVKKAIQQTVVDVFGWMFLIFFGLRGLGKVVLYYGAVLAPLYFAAHLIDWLVPNKQENIIFIICAAFVIAFFTLVWGAFLENLLREEEK